MIVSNKKPLRLCNEGRAPPDNHPLRIQIGGQCPPYKRFVFYTSEVIYIFMSSYDIPYTSPQTSGHPLLMVLLV